MIEQFVYKTLDSGRVIPGYGHRLLNGEDPRLNHLKKFA
jgi:citrate synthase